ncbi:hypothetical protein [Maridesulfovibrio sp. FT414]|uniref:hypothetical protein n=1 Tax=Maridesulfovibrio sp. FT414 TaxID=2979469 RepID=UPI003D806DA8
MKKLLFFLISVYVLCASVPAEALTIRNKCSYPVAGSLKSAESNVNVAQFRLAPGEKIRLLKGFNKTKLIMHMTPDVHQLDELGVNKAEIDNPDTYIELKPGEKGITIEIY